MSQSSQHIPQPTNERLRVWVARICVLIVFAINVQCALSFFCDPGSYVGAYELSGAGARAAVAGIGVAFLMWNATYIPVMLNPVRNHLIHGVVVAQQIIGLVGEMYIRVTLARPDSVLSSSIGLFITFDAAGLILLSAGFLLMLPLIRKSSEDCK